MPLSVTGIYIHGKDTPYVNRNHSKYYSHLSREEYYQQRKWKQWKPQMDITDYLIGKIGVLCYFILFFTIGVLIEVFTY